MKRPKEKKLIYTLGLTDGSSPENLKKKGYNEGRQDMIDFLPDEKELFKYIEQNINVNSYSHFGDFRVDINKAVNLIHKRLGGKS